MLGNRLRTWAMPLLLAVVLGCRAEPDPPSAAEPASSLSTDEQVLLALDYYDPWYKLDAEGRVTNLRLPWRHLPPPVLDEISKLKELQGLDLAGSTVTDDSLAQLKDLQKLRNLGLGQTAVTDEGLKHLEKMASLKNVWVRKPGVTKEAVENLREARPGLNVHWQ